MRPELLRLLADSGGAIHRHEALTVVSPRTLNRLVTRGELVSPLRGVLAATASWTDRVVRCRAALLPAGGEAALSHLTALEHWGLPVPPSTAVHLTVPRGCRLRGTGDVRYHRRVGFRVGAPLTVTRQGLPVVRIERAVVESWPLLVGDARRSAAIAAVAERRTTPGRLRTEARSVPNLPGLVSLERLINLLAAGCHSHLELWGCERVFDHPSLPTPRRQVRVRLRESNVYLDMLYVAERVNVELDGAAHHSADGQRERDIRRDAALGALGILVVRYSPSRIYGEPERVRAELVDILKTRRGR